MWILRLKLMHNDCPIAARCRKFHVISYAYPTSSYAKGGRRCLAAIHFIQGKENDKNKFFKDLKKDGRIKRLEISGNIYSYEIELQRKDEHAQLYYNPALIFVKPVINNYDGFEYWSVACFNKQILMKFIKDLKKHMDYLEVLGVADEKLKDIYFPNVMPSLSEKQKRAVEYAYKRGYYSYPKKINLQQLARELKISAPTLQEHLRKAEIKLLPFIIEQGI